MHNCLNAILDLAGRFGNSDLEFTATSLIAYFKQFVYFFSFKKTGYKIITQHVSVCIMKGNLSFKNGS